MKIEASGWLAEEPGITRVPTRRTSSLTSGKPLGAVSHWSADAVDERGHGDSLYLARSIAELPPKGVNGASWHLMFDRDGHVVQSAPFTVGTWHVGRPGVIEGRPFTNVNNGTLGFELENGGLLLPVAGEYYAWPFWNHDPKDSTRTPNPKLGACPKYRIPKERVAVLPETPVTLLQGATSRTLLFPAGAYERYTEAQEASFQRVVEALARTYGMKETAFNYGHAHFVPLSFKLDPGPLWLGEALPRILRAVFRAT